MSNTATSHYFIMSRPKRNCKSLMADPQAIRDLVDPDVLYESDAEASEGEAEGSEGTEGSESDADMEIEEERPRTITGSKRPRSVATARRSGTGTVAKARRSGSAATARRSGNGSAVTVTPKPVVMDEATARRMEIVTRLAAPVWPELSRANLKNPQRRMVFEALFSIQAMYHSKWFKELPEDMTTFTDMDYRQLTNVIETKARLLKAALSEAVSYVKEAKTDLTYWMIHCNEKYDGDYAVDSTAKVCTFFKYRVERARASSARQGKDRTPSEQTADTAARHVPSRLQKLAEIQDYFTAENCLSKSEDVRSCVQVVRVEFKERAVKPVDFASESAIRTKNITPSEDQELKKLFWKGRSTALITMRSYLLYMLNTTVGRRSHEFRELYMAQLMLTHVPNIEPVAGDVVIASVRHTKTSQAKHESVMTWIRTPEPFNCPVGALANYMVFILDINGHPLFEVMEDDLRRGGEAAEEATVVTVREWWKYKFVFGETNYTQEISYDTHYHNFKDIMRQVDPHGKKLAALYLQRHTVAMTNIQSGLPTVEVAKHQEWSTNEVSSAMNNYTKTSVKTKVVMKSHGWSNKDTYTCWRASGEGDIPAALLAAVFPGLDDLLVLANDHYAKTSTDLSAVEFLKLLSYLRNVFLEDAITMQKRFPDFPAFQHPVFDLPEWAEWVSAEPSRITDRADAWHVSKENPESTRMFVEMQQQQRRMQETVAATHAMVESLKLGRSTTDPTDAHDAAASSQQGTQGVPSIKQVTSIRGAYMEWDKNLRDYFKAHGKPEWSKTFKDGGSQKQKQRFAKIQCTCLYIDLVASQRRQHGVSSSDVIKQLQQTAKDMGVDEPTFVNLWMYMFVQRTTAKGYDRTILVEALETNGLPITSSNTKEMRALLWARGASRCKEKKTGTN